MCYVIKLSFYQHSLLTWPLELHNIVFFTETEYWHILLLHEYSCKPWPAPVLWAMLPSGWLQLLHPATSLGSKGLSAESVPLSGHWGEAKNLAQAGN